MDRQNRLPGSFDVPRAQSIERTEWGDLTVDLPYRRPYDWPAMASFLRARAIRGIELVSPDRYARTVDIDGAHGIVVVEPGSDGALRLRLRCTRPVAAPVVVARVARLFDLTADPQAIGAHLSRDPVLVPLVTARPGLRLPGSWDGFELAVRAVLGQQITVRAAAGLAAKMVALCGEPLEPAGLGVDGLTHVFPRHHRLAAADLSTLGMPRQRAAALSSLAGAVAKNPDVLDAGGTLDERVASLRSLPGIGEWTAQYIAMRALREPDAFPSADVGLLRAIARLEGRTVTSRELLARAHQWRPWRAYAAQHLWASTSSDRAIERSSDRAMGDRVMR